MGRKGIALVLIALLAGSLACDSLPFLTPQPTASPTPTSTDTSTPTSAPTDTPTTYPTRTASPTRIPGIEEPLEIEDATLEIANVILRDEFRCKTDSEPVGNPDAERFLIVLLNVVKGPKLTPYQVTKWVRDNGIDRLGIRSSADDFIEPYGNCPIQNGDNLVLTEIHLAYVVGRNAGGFFLVIPDGREIPLESLVP